MHLVLLLLAVRAAALPSPGQPRSHEAWLREVKSAGVNALHDALHTWDLWLREHPKDAVAAVERCQLIAGTEGEDESLDPQGPTSADCAKDLERDFPDSAVVVLYTLDWRWQKAAIDYGEAALANPRIAFTQAQLARVHEKLARAHEMLEQHDLAAREAREAMRLDPSIDLTNLIGEVLLSQGRKAEAVVALSAHPDGPAFDLQQKARKLVEAGAFFRAQWMLSRAVAAKPGFPLDPALQGRIYEGTGRLREAREAYQDKRAAWNAPVILPRLFNLALAGNDASAANEAYQQLRDQGFKADPLARRRLSLQWKFPHTKWRARDLAGIAALLACVLGSALVPLIGFLPLHAFILWRRLHRPAVPEEPFAWWFRHLYVACAVMLCVQFLGLYVFAYDELAEMLRPLAHSATVTPPIARYGLFYALALAVAYLVMLVRRPQRLRLLGRGSWSLKKCAGQAGASLFFAWLVAAFSGLFFGRPAALSVDGLIRSLWQSYGAVVTLLAVAVLIPICEELLFRSILLDVFSRHLRFWVANLLQAALFAAMHADPLRLLFYGALGLLSGRLRRSSGGLLSSILFHAANNALALMVVVAARDVVRPGKPAPAPDPQLVACTKTPAFATAGSPLALNNLAWAVAIDRSATPACLLEAEKGIEVALGHLPDDGAFLDTKATIVFREGRVDEAIDLERAILEGGAGVRRTDKVIFSQLDRFLRARGASAGSPVKFALEPDGRALQVELKDPLEQGFVLYARETAGPSLLRLAAGPGHAQTYRVPLPSPLPNGAAFEVALLDARGCDACKVGAWEYAVSARDAKVDRYP